MRIALLQSSMLLACLLLAACDVAPPPPADPDAKLDAKAQASADAGAQPAQDSGHHELQDGIDSIDYRDKAAAAGDAVKEADRKREQDLKDAGG